MSKQDVFRQFSRNGHLTVIVRGRCMGRALPEGSRVRVRRNAIYWPGDIVFYWRGDGKLVSHRFLGYTWSGRGPAALTAADLESRPDCPFPTQRLLGKAIQIDGLRARCAPGLRLRAMARYLNTFLARLRAKRVPAC